MSDLAPWWWQRQGLDGTLAGRPAAEVLARTGWARSVGGVNPYLTLFSRGGIGRAAADAAAAKLEIHELPSARGCTYVVPAADFALALKVGQGFSDEAEMKTARKLGVSDAEIDRLCAAVVKALARGPLDPAELREAAGSAARSLGEAGKKKGLTTTLPVALGKLQSAGEIRRVSSNGRLDQQRYRYALWRPNPLSKFRLAQDEAHAELARRFFKWSGPASLAEFRWFSGLGAKAGQAALAALDLVPAAKDDERRMFAEDREALKAFNPPKKPAYSLLSSLDGLFHLRRDVQGLLRAEDRERDVFVDKEWAELGGLSDLPSHAIVDRGRVVGLWEYDPEAQAIAWLSFGVKERALEQAVARTEEFIRSELGDARSFSLDSPKSRAPRIAALRKAGGR